MRALLFFLACNCLFSCKRDCGNLICLDDAPGIQISLMPGDGDTVWVVYHNAISDTLITQCRQSIRSSYWELVDPVDMKNDVSIILPNIDKQYVLTEFKYAQEECEKGCGSRTMKYTVFEGCKVNGTQITGLEIYLQ